MGHLGCREAITRPLVGAAIGPRRGCCTKPAEKRRSPLAEARTRAAVPHDVAADGPFVRDADGRSRSPRLEAIQWPHRGFMQQPPPQPIARGDKSDSGADEVRVIASRQPRANGKRACEERSLCRRHPPGTPGGTPENASSLAYAGSMRTVTSTRRAVWNPPGSRRRAPRRQARYRFG